MNHKVSHSLAGKKVTIKQLDPDMDGLSGREYLVEDYWDRVAGKSWMVCDGNPACMNYAIRTGLSNHKVPFDDEVLYGKVGHLGHLIHVSEIEDGAA